MCADLAFSSRPSSLSHLATTSETRRRTDDVTIPPIPADAHTPGAQEDFTSDGLTPFGGYLANDDGLLRNLAMAAGDQQPKPHRRLHRILKPVGTIAFGILLVISLLYPILAILLSYCFHIL